MIRTAALVFVRDCALLLVRPAGKTAFYMPGGKIEHHESPLTALNREVREELGSVAVPPITHLCDIIAQAYGEPQGVLVRMACFTASLESPPRPCAEIAEIGWFTAADYRLQPDRAPAVEELFKHPALLSTIKTGRLGEIE
ncbi:MAG: NUDIX domain-containing protein [Propionibacteriaceae bacterium]|jgi:8-oxo-dGTP pyrophosphatase MutT (NUDIX family)|nr:NUDIX domain-containing protein [Propionibacteriaceae bacterium]